MWTYVVVGVIIALAVLLCLALAIASFSFDNFNQKLNELSQIENSNNISTLDYVRTINQTYFKNRLQIARCDEFNDHYSSGVVALSDRTMMSNGLSSLAIVSHELGHARQDASGNALKKHWKRRKIGRICGLFFLPLLIVGAIISLLSVFDVLSGTLYLSLGIGCLIGGILIFVFAIILKFLEIKIERQASDYAIEFLQEILTADEVKLCKNFLNSARLTYWASLIRTMLSWTMLTSKEKMFR